MNAYYLVYFARPNGSIHRRTYFVREHIERDIRWQRVDPLYGWKPLYIVRVREK